MWKAPAMPPNAGSSSIVRLAEDGSVHVSVGGQEIGQGAFTVMAWWWLLPPGLALTILSLAFVFIGNTINEILNPRYRERS